MAWFKIDDGLHSSRKFLSIPRRHRFAALGLWTMAGLSIRQLDERRKKERAA